MMASPHPHRDQLHHLLDSLNLAVRTSLPDLGPERSAGVTYEHEVNASGLHRVPEQAWERVRVAGTPLFQDPFLLTLRSKLNGKKQHTSSSGEFDSFTTPCLKASCWRAQRNLSIRRPNGCQARIDQAMTAGHPDACLSVALSQAQDYQVPAGGEVSQMELLPKEMREQLPELYANEEIGLAAQALVKFFTPDSNWTWYASEFNGEDIFFGLVIGFVAEFGYFSLSELESVRGPLGLPIERDEHFEPKTLEELRDHYDQEGYAL